MPVFYFILNKTDHNFACKFRSPSIPTVEVGYECPAGKAVTLGGEEAQFEEKDAAMFISCLPESLRPHFVISRKETEVKKEDMVKPKLENASRVENDAGKSFPAGEPSAEWNVSQLRAWLEEYDSELLAKLRPGSIAETICGRIWKKHYPETFARYQRGLETVGRRER